MSLIRMQDSHLLSIQDSGDVRHSANHNHQNIKTSSKCHILCYHAFLYHQRTMLYTLHATKSDPPDPSAAPVPGLRHESLQPVPTRMDQGGSGAGRGGRCRTSVAAERAAAAVLSCDTKGSPGGARGGFWGLQVIGYIMGTPIPSKFGTPRCVS